MIERFHQSLKSALLARLGGSDWFSHVPLVMLGLGTAPKDDSGFSPAEAVYGKHLSLPSENTQNFLQRFSSGKWSQQSLVSPDLCVIM